MNRWSRLFDAHDRRREERRQRRCVAMAAALFARLEPAWAASLFDEPFLSRFEPAALLRMEPRQLAMEWTRQFRYGDPRRRERDVRAVTAVAAGFLDLLQRVMRDEGAVSGLPRMRGHGATLAP